jgi:hypothetical protein
MTDKLVNDQLRKELEPELKELAERYYQKGLRDAAGGGGATTSAFRTAEDLAKKARQKMAAAAAIGLPMTNEEAVKLAYAEAGIPLD